MSAWSARYPMQLEEEIDYYLENGLMVMTEKFHQDRGYCCGSGCRHCPYKTKHQRIKELMQNR